MILAILSVTSCKYRHQQVPENSTDTTLLQRVTAKRLLYCQLSREKYLNQQFVGDECDSLLFTSLRGIGCGDVDLGPFESSAGEWFRNPHHNCLSSHNSHSDISKDMFLGLISYALWADDRGIMRRLIYWGGTHLWIMGGAQDLQTMISECMMSPQLIHDVYEINDKISGSASSSPSIYDRIFSSVPENVIGYRAHLLALHTLLTGRLYGAITDIELMNLNMQVNREPNNALFQAALHLYSDGNQEAAARLLLDEETFPAERLPGSVEYCTSYLYQRDESSVDWGPCAYNGIHDGTDFIFAAAVVDGTYMRGKGGK